MQCNNIMEKPFAGQNLGSLLLGHIPFARGRRPRTCYHAVGRPSRHVVMKLTKMLPHGMVEFGVAYGVNYCGSSNGMDRGIYVRKSSLKFGKDERTRRYRYFMKFAINK
ncbi:hypothetical protein CEXT_439751 [Caerostris extrusa]|uniref:Uncharacterized protein n=1 Tax=Caerostris extrusa TaxID=172846 RepID=A0AAV4XYX3_CAEEX|nr:hypothetical protein CEXT_439751 [Caerostris extrusa]